MALNVVITMAGRGSRFREAGYSVPKYEIAAHGRSLFEWSLLSLRHFVEGGSRVVFVCLAENDSSGYVRNAAKGLGLPDVRILELEQVTDGQATSAWLSRDVWRQDQPLLIYNIDTYVNPRSLRPSLIRPGSDGWIPCFQSVGDHWSFVRLDDSGWATEVAEKRRISDHASVGLYWFRVAGDYLAAYEAQSSGGDGIVKGERYVAPLYASLIRGGKHVSASDLPASDVHVLGTPGELRTFLQKDPGEVL